MKKKEEGSEEGGEGVCIRGVEVERGKKESTSKPVFPKRSVPEGTTTSAHESFVNFFSFCLIVFVHCPHLLQNVRKLEATARQIKSETTGQRDRMCVRGLTKMATPTYSLFYKNSGIEITSSSPNIDISIHLFLLYRYKKKGKNE